MTRYVGGADGRVFAVGSGVRELGRFQWGGLTAPCAKLAKVLLRDMLDDDDRANNLHRRFLHRTIAGWAKDKIWTQTDSQLMAVVDDIERVEKETALDRQMMARELPKGGTGAMGARDLSEWGGTTHQRDNRAPEIKRNDPWKSGGKNG